MEIYNNYKGYGITYMTLTGTTVVDKYGFNLIVFAGLGQAKGSEKAKSFVDGVLNK